MSMIEAGMRNVHDEATLNFLQNFIEDLKELLGVYQIQNIHGWDDGSIVLTTQDGIEYDLKESEH